MDSDTAADVRDAINGLPCVAYDPDLAEYSNTPFTSYDGTTYTGEFLRCDKYAFRPATIHQAGEIAFGDGPRRPCYEVVLEPLTLPTRPLPSLSVPSAVVHEVAKFDCLLRVRAGYRGEWKPGTIQIRNDLAHEHHPDADGDRCPDCRGTRFKLKRGVPECERCGTRVEDTGVTDPTPTLEDYI